MMHLVEYKSYNFYILKIVPSDQVLFPNKQYVSLLEYGINKVAFIDSLDNSFNEAIKDILNSPLTGIDTEFTTQTTKLVDQGTQL